MRILLDTHIWLWYSLGNSKLSQNLQAAIANLDNELWLSPISVWEALLLAEKSRIILPPDPFTWIDVVLKALDINEAPLTHEIAILSRKLDCPHQDPADRFIAATAIHYNLQLATVDQNLVSLAFLRTIS